MNSDLRGVTIVATIGFEPARHRCRGGVAINLVIIPKPFVGSSRIKLAEIAVALVKRGPQRIAGTVVGRQTDIDDLLRHGSTSRNERSRTGLPRKILVVLSLITASES